MKDNFSGHSSDYAKFRPEYPAEVYTFLKENLSGFDCAWDCGTGNGQVASRLADFFNLVEATDISQPQLKNAIQKNAIHYSLQPAEKVNFPDAVFDLVICGQSVHWFDFAAFFSEATRCLKKGGLLVLMGYGLIRGNQAFNQVMDHFYQNIIGPYWDPERRHLDNEYQDIPFPFEEIPAPKLDLSLKWDITHLLGYLRTWSAVKHYEKAHGKDPVQIVEKDLKNSFGNSGSVKFPIILRAGRA
ncbi:MAG: class I SAM-dependent methyltransferase [Christiangramia sp.]|mgnify:CR=1 FL=1|nr:SAM-dependent methyltransferase [Christiangramia sp.]